MPAQDNDASSSPLTLQTLKKRSDFLRVQSAGTKWVSRSLILEAVAGKEGQVRYGITVSRRVSLSAVLRNRIKRRLRALADEILPQAAREGADYVLIGRPETATRTYAALQNDLKWCLDRLGYGKGTDKGMNKDSAS